MISSLSISKKEIAFFEEKYRLKIDKSFIAQTFSPFIQTDYFFNYEQLLATSKKNERVAIQIKQINTLIEQIAQDNNIHLIRKENIILELYNAHLLENYDPRSGYILYDRNTLFLNRLRKMHPKFYNSAKLRITEFRKNKGLNLMNKNINYMLYVLVVEWIELLPRLREKNKAFKALILSNRTISHSRLLKYILETEFLHLLTADIYTDSTLSIKDLKKLPYDFIVSNFPIPDSTNIESFYIENFPSKNQLLQIKNHINKLQNKK